jgi:hypothetical protein
MYCELYFDTIDVLTRRLARHLLPAAMLRLSWWQRPIAAMPSELLRYCSIDTTVNLFTLPDHGTLHFVQLHTTTTQVQLLHNHITVYSYVVL